MVSRYIINGRKKLSGEVEVQGSKNSSLPILAATLLTKGENVLFNCPRLSDIEAAFGILRYLGCEAKLQNGAALVNCGNLRKYDIPDAFMREMRGSIVFLGALLSRCGKALLTFPGGCELGPRPIDLHLKALRAMGATITERYGIIECSAADGLIGAPIALSFPSVGATENIILAAALAKGTTTITNAAREPEVSDLCDYLNSCGADIHGAGEGTIVINGVSSLSAVSHTIIPDRIVAATLMSAAAVTGSEIYLEGISKTHLGAVISVFDEAGCESVCREGCMRFKAPERLRAVSLIRTMPYPGFPTDAQAPVMSASAVSEGSTVFVENIFENRFKHVGELCRLGAEINVEGKVAVVKGVDRLYGARIEAQDLRGAAGLLVAALAAEGESELSGINYLERGYESFEQTLASLGADVVKI